MKRSFFSLVALAILAGCATQYQPYQPIVDTRGVDQNRYQADLSDCNQYAARVDPSSDAATGAGGGAVIGAILGNIIGGNRRGTGSGAVIGALIGGAGSGTMGVEEQRNIVRRCMAGRGYAVLR